MKRYIRIDIEYECDKTTYSWDIRENIGRILKEDMPYCKILFSRDSLTREDLNREAGSRK